MRLKDKVAIVTGSGRGLGESIATRFAAEGAAVVVTDIDPAAAQGVANGINTAGGRALAIPCDVTDAKSVQAMVATARDAFGPIGILVNCAGGSARDKASMFHESTEEVWDEVISRNLKSALICTRAVVNEMIAQKAGRIINFSAGSALDGQPGLADYSAAKAGVIGFTKSLARELGSYGITVNCITPGIIETRAIAAVPKEVADRLLKKIVMGRMGKPEELANNVLFLASDEASYITGQNHVVCGGAYIQ